MLFEYSAAIIMPKRENLLPHPFNEMAFGIDNLGNNAVDFSDNLLPYAKITYYVIRQIPITVAGLTIELFCSFITICENYSRLFYCHLFHIIIFVFRCKFSK